MPLVALLFGAGFAIHAGWSASGLIDDAYIAFRYAASFARGDGLTFNPGERVEGFTSFSWVLLAAMFARLGLDPAGIMPLVGIVFGAALVVFVAHQGRVLAESEDRPHPAAGIPAAVFVALTPSLAFYAGTGLETALAALLQTMAAVFAQRRRPVAFALSAGLSLMTRPEAGLVLVLGFAWLAWPGRGRERTLQLHARLLGPSVLLLALLVIPFLALKLAYFGALLPNTLVAKPPNRAEGAEYALWCLPPLVGLVLAAGIDARRRFLFVVWAASFVGIALEGGDWMGGSRMAVPSLATLALAADRALLGLERPWTLRRSAPAALAWLLTLAGAALSWREAQNLRAEGLATENATRIRAALLAEMRAAGVRSLGTLDIGLPGYLHPDLALLDLGGLTDRTIARAPGDYKTKAVPLDYLMSRAPDAFLFAAREPLREHPDGTLDFVGHYPVEERIAQSAWFRDHYRARAALTVTPSYQLVWFSRVLR